MNETILCRCGHTKKDHDVELFGGTASYCQAQTHDSTGRKWADSCKFYVPDNLKYIERRYTDRLGFYYRV